MSVKVVSWYVWATDSRAPVDTKIWSYSRLIANSAVLACNLCVSSCVFWISKMLVILKTILCCLENDKKEVCICLVQIQFWLSLIWDPWIRRLGWLIENLREDTYDL
jgi:hypothetical protein